MLTAKQNQKFPFHFLSAPPTEEKEMQGKIFGFCSRDRRVRSEYVELRKTLSILYSKCERCTAPVRSGRGARHLFWKNGGNQWDALRASHLLALKKPSSSILVLGTGLAPACPKGRYHLKVVRLLSFATRALLFLTCYAVSAIGAEIGSLSVSAGGIAAARSVCLTFRRISRRDFVRT